MPEEEPQAPNQIIDSREQAGLTPSSVERSIKRAFRKITKTNYTRFTSSVVTEQRFPMARPTSFSPTAISM